MNQAVTIIRQRVDASGVGEADVTTQSGNQIVVQIPGQADEETRNRIEASAQLQLRAVLYTGAPANTFVGDDGKTTPYPTPDPTLVATPTASPTNGSDTRVDHTGAAGGVPRVRLRGPGQRPGIASRRTSRSSRATPSGNAKYILGPVELDGSSITDASFGLQQSNGLWAVNLKFNDDGHQDVRRDQPAPATARRRRSNQFAFVLDGKVLSAPSMNAIILGGDPSITGSFTQESSKTLADQLKYGALPLSFTVAELELDLGDTRLAAAGDRRDRGSHRSRAGRDLLAHRLSRARLHHHRLARGDGRADLR